LGPFALAITAARALEPHNYPAGDVRNEPVFWALVGLVTLLFVGTLMTLALRHLRHGVGGKTADIEEPARDISER
jgi:hypothetical protein